MKKLFLLIALSIGLLLTSNMYNFTYAQEADEDKEETSSDADNEDNDSGNIKKNSKIKDISKVVKRCTKHEGLFTVYQDTLNGSLYLQIETNKLEKEFIYFGYAENGIPFLNMFRGAYREVTVFKPIRYFNRIEFEVPNYNFYFDPENPISKAADANISDAIIYSSTILGASKDGDTLIIKADDLFMKETLTKIKQKVNRNLYQVGKLSKKKSKVTAIKNYSDNTDVIIEYVFESSNPERSGGKVLADDRSVSFVFQHSFIEVPDNDYEPRRDDSRIGYFTTEFDDMTSLSTTPYRDIIHRWNLIKKNPDQKLSEPVKPIVFWIENTTPYEFRPAVEKGVLNWNKAFEKIGFKNAIVVKQMPDNATWEPGDLKYNVIRWTASPTPRFAGYGPRFFNPKTGEILGADVMLEYSQFKLQRRYEKMFTGESSLELELDYDNLPELTEAEMYAQNLEFGQSLVVNNEEYTELVNQYVIALVTHEVGHTLGLTHNFKGSYFLSPEELQDKELTEKYGVTASIMDYMLINVSPDPEKQAHYFSTTIGPYDYWAIEYGYKSVENDSELEEIAKRSTEKGHIFGNDGENARNLRIGIDPRILTHDLSNDPIQYSIDRLDLVIELINKLPQKYANGKGSYHDLRYEFSLLINQYKNAVATISRYIGGIYTERVFADQNSGKIPYTPVPKETQQKAMKALHKYVFAKDALNFSEFIYRYAQIQRRGFNVGRDAFPVHAMVNDIQREALAPVLNPVMFSRMLDSEKYGNGYELGEYMSDIRDLVFDYNYKAEINSYQQYAQALFVKQLTKMFGQSSIFNVNRYPYQARALVVEDLLNLQKQLKYKGDDKLTKAHQEQIKKLIENAFNFM